EHRLCRVDGNGKANAGALLHPTGQDHGVDADDLSTRVQQRPAGVAGIDGSVGLDGLVNESSRSAHGADGADDAAGPGSVQSKRIADGKYLLSYHQTLRIADLGSGHRLDGNLNHSQIVGRIGPHNLGLVFFFVAGSDLKLARVLDHVIV